jgi:hypothetical protein
MIQHPEGIIVIEMEQTRPNSDNLPDRSFALDKRKKAMMEFVGIRKDRSGFTNTAAYVRSLRKSMRRERLYRADLSAADL